MTISAVTPGLIPDHYFRTLCQSERCRASLGGFHIPHVGGVVLYACHRCRLVSVFRSEQFGIRGYLVNTNGEQLDPKTLRLLNAPAAPVAPPVKAEPTPKSRKG